MSCNFKTACVDVWAVNLDQHEFDLKNCESILDDHQRIQAQKFRNPHLREHYCVVQALLRHLLADYLTVEPAKLTIQRTIYGKPYLTDHPQVKFNLSHSGRTLVFAICREYEVGIDVEQIRHRQNIPGMVKRCFSAAEQHYWHGLPESAQLAHFFQFWTRKEAFVKAVGRGIALGLEQCELDLTRPGYFLNIPLSCGSTDAWRVTDLDLGTLNCAALVVNASAIDFTFRDFDTPLMKKVIP